jgi:isopentenyl-diphosphate Delta-isomerase
MEDRKNDHINLALANRTSAPEKDKRFVYEPLLSGHGFAGFAPFELAGKSMKAPLWISSMTGGGATARRINTNLATAASEFGLGMGLGSCRILLESDNYLPDFDMRDIIGNQMPFFANLGIAQVENMLEKGTEGEIDQMIRLLRCDGLVVHVNPMQEWFQPEGDRLKHAPIYVIKELINNIKFPVIVKEVGQGMGKQSLKELMQLPLAAIEFGAFGGTNFARVEMERRPQSDKELFEPLIYVGQTAEDMINDFSALQDEGSFNKVTRLIISGGIKNYLDGYYYINKSPVPAAYGMASGFLKYARNDYNELKHWVYQHIQGLKMAYAYLKVV